MSPPTAPDDDWRRVSGKSLSRTQSAQSPVKGAQSPVKGTHSPQTFCKDMRKAGAKSDQVCKDFLNGQCTRGSACIYSHVVDSDTDTEWRKGQGAVAGSTHERRVKAKVLREVSGYGSRTCEAALKMHGEDIEKVSVRHTRPQVRGQGKQRLVVSCAPPLV